MGNLDQEIELTAEYDPLLLRDLEVTDISTARYALKLANEAHFGIIYARRQMEKELSRSRGEVDSQELMLVLPYLPKVDSYGRTIQYSRVPNPLPAKVPAQVRAAIDHLEAQYQVEVARAQAELAEQIQPLQAQLNYLCELAGAWFKRELGASWLGGKNYATLGGCTISFDGELNFTFAELSYD